MSDVKKLTPYSDGQRRRMIMSKLSAVAILPGGRGANPGAHMTFYKSAEKQGGKRPGETEQEFRARMRREREAEKQESEQERRRRRRRDDPSYSKQDGPRRGESFEAFLARMREEDDTMTEARARRMFDGDAEKASGDLVDFATGAAEGHQHAISFIRGDDFGMVVHYAMGNDQERPHDHQIVKNPDGTYSVTENAGHTHDINSADLQRAIAESMMKQGPDRETRDRLAESGEALPDGSFPIRNGTDLRNAIQAFGRASEEDRTRVARHIRRRARALDMADQLPEEGVLADLLKSAGDGEEEQAKGDSDMADKEQDALKARVAHLTAVAALSGAHKSHFDTLDEDGQAAFLKMDNAEKDAAIKAAETAKAEADPVVYTADNGAIYKSSDDPRLVAMAKERDTERKETIRLQKVAEDQALEKRASTELANLPGELSVRKEILRQVEKIEDEETRKSAMDVLKSQNARMGGVFKTFGSGGEPAQEATTKSEANAELDRMAKELAAKTGDDFYTAYSKVADQNPDLVAKAM